MDQLDRDFQTFMDTLADEGIIRRVVIDGEKFYFNEDDPQYREYLTRKEEENSENLTRYA